MTTATLTKAQATKLVTSARTAIGRADTAQMPVAELFARLYNGHAHEAYGQTFREFWRETVGVSSDTFKLARASRQALMIATPDATAGEHQVMSAASIGTISQERNELQDAGKATFAVAGAGGRPRGLAVVKVVKREEETGRVEIAKLLRIWDAEEVVAAIITVRDENVGNLIYTPWQKLG